MTLTHDGRGNVITSGANAYTYTSENLMKTATGGISLNYDAVGRLAQYDAALSTRFVYDGAFSAAEMANPSGAVIRRYVHGPGDDEPLIWYEGSSTSDRRWLHADERGSIIAVSNAAGDALAINRYDEYGIPATSNFGRFQYTGQQWLPELGMSYYKARMYSYTLGRFMQTDPIGYGDGVNLYNYVGGDPVNFRDPSGLCQSAASEVGGCFASLSRQNGRETGEGAWLWNYISSQNQGDGYGNGGIGAFQDVRGVHNQVIGDYIASRIAYAAGYNIHGRYVGYNPLEGGAVDQIHVFAERAVPQNDQGKFCPAAWTPDGDTKGERPNPDTGRWNTDLPGGFPDAEAVLQGLSRLAGDNIIIPLPNPLRPDILQRSLPSGTQLRIGKDFLPRLRTH